MTSNMNNDNEKTNGSHNRSVNVSGLSWEIALMKDENGNDVRFDFLFQIFQN